MSIQIEDVVASSLVAAGTQNNPLICWNNFIESGGRTLTTNGGTELADGSAENLSTGFTSDYWQANPSGTAVNLEIQFTTNRQPDFVGISAHNLSDIGASVAFQKWNGSSWEGVGTGSVTPADNKAIGFYFDPDGGSTLWRLRVTNVVATDTVIIGVLFVGKAMQLPRRLYQAYDPVLVPNEVDLRTNVSEGANYLGSSYVERGIRLSAKIAHLTPAFTRTTAANDGFQTFLRHYNAGKPFYWAWRPTQYEDLYWCWRSGPAISAPNTGPQAFQSLSMQMRGYYDE